MQSATVCNEDPYYCITIVRLQSVTNNRGYQLHLSYANNSPVLIGDTSSYETITGVTAINTAVDYCAPTASTCTGLTVTWPSISFGLTSSGSNLVQSVTDPLGRVTKYTYDSAGRILNTQRPISSTPTTTYSYSGSSSQISSVSNGVGTWSYAYSTDVSGSPITTVVTDPLSHTRTSVVDLTKLVLTSDTDGVGNTTNYSYDSYGRLTQVTLPRGNNVQYAVDARGNITQTTNVAVSGSGLSNVVTSAAYDTTCTYTAKCNQPNSTTDANGNVTTYTYDNTYGVLLTATSPAPTSGAVQPKTTLGYSSLYAYYKQTSGGSVAVAPSPIRLLTSTSICQTTSSCTGGSDEVKSTVTYGSTGVANNLLPTAVSKGAGDGSLTATTSTTYDNVGNTQTVQGPLGSAYTTRYRYDADNEIIGKILPDPDGSGSLHYPATRYTYNADGLVTLVEQGTVNSQSDSDWAAFATKLKAATGYDALDRKIYDISANSSGTDQTVTQYAYDNADRMTCTALRMNSALFGSLSSSPLGTLPSSACTAGTSGSNGPDRITTYAYDNADRLTVTAIASGTGVAANYSTVTYSANSKMLSIADARSNLTTYAYDGFDRLAKVSFPSPTTPGTSSTTDYESYGYDANSNLLSVRRRDGNSLNFCFDALNRQTRKDFPGSTSSNCTLTSLSGSVFSAYDLLNCLTFARFGSTTGTGISYGYDALSRKTSETAPSGTIGYQYDVGSELTRITWPDSFYAGYGFDLLGRVVSINENGATSGAGLLATYAYDDLGHRTGLTRGNGTTTSYSYDTNTGRLSGLTNDLSGTTNDLTLGYAYSVASQILTRSVSNTSYTSHPSATSRAYVSNGLDQYTSVAGTSYTYDARGNLTSDGARTFTYDSENRLLTASAPTALTLAYDPVGRLQTSTASSATTTMLYAGSNLVAEYSGSTLLRRYVPGAGTDEPLVWYEGSGTSDRRWLHGDDQGSVIAYSTGSGASGATYGYGPNGEPNAWSGSRYRYTGQLMLPEAQLYYYKARVYDPVSGRFLQTDPVGYDSDINPYTYTLNDPVNATDPTGQRPAECINEQSGCVQPTQLADVFVNALRKPTSLDITVKGTIHAQIANTSPVINVGRGIPAGTGGNAGGAPQNNQQPQPQKTPTQKCSASSGAVAGGGAMLGVEVIQFGAAGGRVGALLGEVVEPVGGGIPAAAVGVIVGGIVGAGVYAYDRVSHGQVSSNIPGLHCGNNN